MDTSLRCGNCRKTHERSSAVAECYSAVGISLKAEYGGKQHTQQATRNQLNWIGTMLLTRDVPADLSTAQTFIVRTIRAGQVPLMTKAEATRWIDALKSLHMRRQAGQ